MNLHGRWPQDGLVRRQKPESVCTGRVLGGKDRMHPRHPLRFPGIDLQYLSVELARGGVSVSMPSTQMSSDTLSARSPSVPRPCQERRPIALSDSAPSAQCPPHLLP